MTDIEWTSRTWNPIVGCTRVSPGCEHCYAERFVHRGMAPQHRGLTVLRKQGPGWTGEVRLVESALGKPLSWRKPQRVFVNSLSDLFHEQLSNETIARVFAIMAGAPHITFQILTKRPARMREWFRWIETAPAWRTEGRHDPVAFLCGTISEEAAPLPSWVGEEGEALFAKMNDADWPLANVWLGVTAEDQQRADERIPLLLDTPAAVRFVSYEPAIGPVDFKNIESARDEMMLPLAGLTWSVHFTQPPRVVRKHPKLDWLIVGGESGPKARPFNLAWARHALAQCRLSGVPAFFKQAGAKPYVCIGNHDNAGDGADVDCKGEAGFGCEVLKLKHGKGADLSELPTWARVREFPRGTP